MSKGESLAPQDTSILLAVFPNIIYKKQNGEISENAHVIYGNVTAMDITLRPKHQYLNHELSPIKIANVHLSPFSKCYWNECTFCGINQKYKYFDIEDDDIVLNMLHDKK